MTLEIKVSRKNLGFIEKGMTGTMKRAVALGVRDSLTVIQKAHNTMFLLGRSKQPAVPGEITWRTGALAKSYRTFWKAGQLSGYFGSTLRRAGILEHGGIIRARYKEWLHFFIQYGNVGWVRVKEVEIKGRFLLKRVEENQGVSLKIEDVIARAFLKGADDAK